MDAKDIIRLPDGRDSVRAVLHEVVREVSGKPQVFIRVRLTGWSFPHRAREPFVVIGDAVSSRVVIDADGTAANAYFDKPLPDSRAVGFGYGNVLKWQFDTPVVPAKIERLDRSRLPPGVIDPFRR
jgi:hypothetical protein